MQVYCKCHGKKIERANAFKVVLNGKNQYYCNEQEYINIQNNKKIKDNTYNLINDVFGYKVINTAIYKEINELLLITDYKTICDFIIAKSQYLSNVLNKDFNSEYAKIRYFATIIKNGLKDFKTENKEEVIKQSNNEFYESKYKPKARKKSLLEYEEGD